MACILGLLGLFSLSSLRNRGHPTLSGSFSGRRVLYIVTTLNEYDNGKRATKSGFDRLQETLIPVVREGVESMLSFGFDVDVMIISNYEMTREQLIRDALPPSVGLECWGDATPMAYRLEENEDHDHITFYTRALARQHRFVIKDNLEYYDVFVNFEDDMLIKGNAVQNYLHMTEEINRMKALAPETIPKGQEDKFLGAMSKSQLQRMVPGFIRVEVLLDEEKYGAQDELDPIPVTNRPNLDPKPCCHIENPLSASENRPQNPESDKLFLWETGIKALGVRKMPASSNLLDWVLLQRGPEVDDPRQKISDYWSGKDGYFGTEKRPSTKKFGFINNQGGWMATRKQIWEWHTEVCPGGFLPPYDVPDYHFDGLDMRNVEYWSGGISLFTKRHACNLQRFISLDPDHFNRQLLCK